MRNQIICGTVERKQKVGKNSSNLLLRSSFFICLIFKSMFLLAKVSDLSVHQIDIFFSENENRNLCESLSNLLFEQEAQRALQICLFVFNLF